MGKRNQRRRRNKVNTAGDNGMQKVVNWNLQDAVPVLTGPSIITADAPIRVDFSAGVNRFSWQIQ